MSNKKTLKTEKACFPIESGNAFIERFFSHSQIKLMMSLWSKPYGALTIQMKPLLQYFHKRMFIFQHFTNKI